MGGASRSVLGLDHLPDEVPLAGPNDLVGPADVLADEPDPHHGHADQEEEDAEERERPALLRAKDEAAQREDDHEEKTAGGAGHRDHREELERGQRESRDQVEVQPDE